ncbi:class II aldolase/adducin family protein [Sphingobium xenophagum]|uniref:class II aldolase/adducin family protein n=1 Tax=Sphingobium xenophagum TaxID=121428 RepID=UPI0003727A6D|nr:class II aldolase/adducin family protein [Sphingobium xenophagum]
MSTLDEARTTVATGSRVLAAQGILDAFGHLSCRSPERPDHFLISRNLAPAMVSPDDVVELDLDGEQVAGAAPARLFLERFIHGEIYRLRPDVQAIVHSHASPVVPFTLVPGVKLRPICHMCGFLEGTPRPFDVADHAGPASDLLISSRALGRNLAEHLGNARVTLMRAHGYTVVGDSVAQAVYRAIYTMRNCEIELSARVLGEPVFLSPQEAESCERTIGTQCDRAWNLWVHQLHHSEAG